MLDFNTVSDTKPRILIPKRYREQSRHFYRESPPLTGCVHFVTNAQTLFEAK